MDLTSLIALDQQLLLWFNSPDSFFVDHFALAFTSGLTWLPLYVALFYLVMKNNQTMPQICLIVLCAALCVVCADAVPDYLCKPLVGRYRPCWEPAIKDAVRVVDGYRAGGWYGFFSAHAANTFSVALFFAMLVRSRLLSATLIVWSLTNCWTRLHLGVHYPGDVLVGLLWGAVVAGAVYALYHHLAKRVSHGGNYVSTKYTATGYALSDIDVVMTVAALTLLYAVARGSVG